ncbi:MAG: hypothetical protein WD096_02665 [Actinomycetota bacterium]
MRPTHVALLTAALLMTAPCAESRTTPSSEPGLFFATDPERHAFSMQALYRGPLAVRDACVLIGHADEYSLPIWPKGFTTERDGSGRLVVRDSDGGVVAIEGEIFEMGGGYVAEFSPHDKVEAPDDQIRRVEDALGYTIPERCLGPDVYGIWGVGET